MKIVRVLIAGICVSSFGFFVTLNVLERFDHTASATTQTAAVANTVTVNEQEQTESVPKHTDNTARIFFVGDIMLGRYVETLMGREGADFPFRNVYPYIKSADLAVGNFEGTVSEIHKQTPSMGFQFSIRPEYLAELKKVGFDVLSLANNHSNDYGAASHRYTQLVCAELSIMCGGHFGAPDHDSLVFKTVKDTRIGFLMLHTTQGEPTPAVLEELMEQLVTKSDIRVVYIHWGEEYLLTHTPSQRVFAEKLIDLGADTVIGHHPHVIEDIELYKGKPIFYSLGNFIFDQYFNADVQEGLGVELAINDTTLTYTLIPFTSRDIRSQPRPMTAEESKRLFKRVLEPVSALPEVKAASGTLTLPRVVSGQ